VIIVAQRSGRQSARRGARPAKRTQRRAGRAARASRSGRRAGAGYPVVHFEINARDPRALHDFYSSLFGWKINADNPMGYGLVTAGGKGINGGIGPAQGAPHVTFYVAVPDLESALRKAGELGGSTVVPPTEIPNMVTFAIFTDPQGHRIGLIRR
jgi:predicted enzyme related to lactoylglutathione lyase